MKYKVIKTTLPQSEEEESKVAELEVDDLILFNDQPTEFKELFNSIHQDNIAEFDNAMVMLFVETGRVIVSQ